MHFRFDEKRIEYPIFVMSSLELNSSSPFFPLRMIAGVILNSFSRLASVNPENYGERLSGGKNVLPLPFPNLPSYCWISSPCLWFFPPKNRSTLNRLRSDLRLTLLTFDVERRMLSEVRPVIGHCWLIPWFWPWKM